MASKVHLFLLKRRGGGGAPPVAEKLRRGSSLKCYSLLSGIKLLEAPREEFPSIHTFLIKNLLCKNCQYNTRTQIIVDIFSLRLSLKILSSKFLKMPMQALILQA